MSQSILRHLQLWNKHCRIPLFWQCTLSLSIGVIKKDNWNQRQQFSLVCILQEKAALSGPSSVLFLHRLAETVVVNNKTEHIPHSPLSACIWCRLPSGITSPTNAFQGHPLESTSMQLPIQGLLPSTQKSAGHAPAFVTEQQCWGQQLRKPLTSLEGRQKRLSWKWTLSQLSEQKVLKVFKSLGTETQQTNNRTVSIQAFYIFIISYGLFKDLSPVK